MTTTLDLETPAAEATVNVARPGVSGADVLAVIPVLNEAAHIETCLRSLMIGDERLRSVVFVVVDGGSKDETPRIVESLQAEFPNLHLMNNPRRLQSTAVNLAARDCGTGRRMMVRCDAHSIYPANYVMAVADALASRGVESIVVPMDARGDGCFQRANAWVVDTLLGSGGSTHRGGRKSMFVDHGHHAGFDLKAFLGVGGYDESFSHNEDAEFDTRLRRASGKIFLDTGIRLHYLPRASVGSLARQYFNYGKGRARTLMKHGERPRLRQLIPPATLVGCVLGLAISPINVWGLILPGSYLAALMLASIVIAIKHRSACGLLAGLASGTIHMSWSAGMLRQMLRGQRPV